MSGCISLNLKINSDSNFESIIKNSIQIAFKQVYDETVNKDNMYTVWFCKVLQNFKAIVVIKKDDAPYFFCECTYNGDRNEIYIDMYKKHKNFVIYVSQSSENEYVLDYMLKKILKDN